MELKTENKCCYEESIALNQVPHFTVEAVLAVALTSFSSIEETVQKGSSSIFINFSGDSKN